MLKEYVSAGSAGREKGVPTPSRVPSRAVGTVGWAANEGSSGLPKATKKEHFCQEMMFLQTH